MTDNLLQRLRALSSENGDIHGQCGSALREAADEICRHVGNPWKEAVIDACITNHISWHDDDPRRTLQELMAWEQKIALDPAVSAEARALEQKHLPMFVREGVCLVCGGAVLNSGEHLEPERHASVVECITTDRPGGNACGCRQCKPPIPPNFRMIVCAKCGNKRCPHANDHRNACTNSNDTGQPGSAYP